MATDPKDIVIPNVEKAQPAAVVEEEPIEPCCSRIMSFLCFGVVGLTFFIIFTTVTSVLVFGSGYEFCNGYVMIVILLAVSITADMLFSVANSLQRTGTTRCNQVPVIRNGKFKAYSFRSFAFLVVFRVFAS